MKMKTMKSKSHSNWKYKTREPETIKRRSEQTSGRFDSPYKANTDVWRPKAGDNTIRILPPTWDDAEHFGLDVWVHRWIGDNGSYLCLNKMKNKPCPICRAAKAASDAGETDDAKALQVTRVVLCWILDRDDDNGNPQLYPMSVPIDRDIAALCYNKKTGNALVIDHPEEGYDVSFRRTGDGLKTRYSAFQIDRDPSPISENSKEMDAVLDFITENPLPSVLAYKDAKYLEGVLAGQTEAKDEDLEDEDDEDEDTSDTETEETEDTDDEEEDSRGKRSVKGKPRRKADDDEDEEEDDDDLAEEDDDEENDEDDGEEGEEDEEVEEKDTPRRRVATSKRRPNQTTKRPRR